MDIQSKIEKFKNCETKNEFAVSLIDVIFDLEKDITDLINFESFEIQFIKNGGKTDDYAKELFSVFLNKEKSKIEISFINYILTIGLKIKYEKFKDPSNIVKLKEIYDLAVFIEKRTEFTVFEYIESIFSENQLENFYKLIYFYIFQLTKKERSDSQLFIFTLSIELYKEFKNFTISNETYNEVFYLLDSILEFMNRLDLLIKYFFKFSKDKYIFYFLINHKKVTQFSYKIKYFQEEGEELFYFLACIIVFNQYFKFEDDLVVYIKNSYLDRFYLFLKAIIFRFDYYQLNKDNHYLFYLLINDLLENKNEEFLKKFLSIVQGLDYSVLAPIIINIIQQIKDKEEQQTVVLQTLISIISTITQPKEQDVLRPIYQLLNFLLNFLLENNFKDRLLNLIIGRFHHYIFEDNESTEIEQQLFFFLSNLFMYKYKDSIENPVIIKIFKMTLKFFELFIKNSDQNIFLLTLHKIYLTFLNDFLKEHQITNEMFNDFFLKIKSNFEDNDLVKYNQLLSVLPTGNEFIGIGMEDMNFDMIGELTRQKLVENSSITNQKLITYPIIESDCYILTIKEYKILVFLKIFMLFDVFYAFFKNIFKTKLKIKRDKNKVFIFDSNQILKDSMFVDDFKITPFKFYYHYLNQIFSFLLLFIMTFIGFRVLFDGLIIGNKMLTGVGVLLMLVSLFIDYYLYYFYIKIKDLLFFKVEINNVKSIIYTSNPEFVKIFKEQGNK